jgi:phosphoglycolate phosphatase
MNSAELRVIDDKIPIDPDSRPLALFDLDGTITDPADGILSCHRWALEQVGFSIPDGFDTSILVGPPAEEAHALLGVPSDRIAESTRLYRERFAIAGWLDDTPYPGVVDLVHRLVDAGWLVGVATMKLEPFAKRIIDRIGLGDLMHVVVGSDGERTRTTKRAIIEFVLSNFDKAPSGVVMIGDRRHDIEAALSLQMTAIGVAWGFGSIEELIAANAHAIAATPTEVAEFLLA